MKFLVAILLLAAGPVMAGEALGPSGMGQAVPFSLDADYEADFMEAPVCEGYPEDAKQVREGMKAVYVIYADDVVVLQDELARRFSIDYCWQ